MSATATISADTCVWVDIYGFAFPCDQVPADPCVDDGNGFATMWRAQPCEGDGMPAFCAAWPDHPVCPTTPIVEVGQPPVPVVLPATGTGLGVTVLLALFCLGVGNVLRLASRRKL